MPIVLTFVASGIKDRVAYAIKYCKWGKIHWAKLLRIPLNEVFHKKLLWCLTKTLILYMKLVKYSWENFAVLLKTAKNAKV